MGIYKNRKRNTEMSNPFCASFFASTNHFLLHFFPVIWSFAKEEIGRLCPFQICTTLRYSFTNPIVNAIIDIHFLTYQIQAESYLHCHSGISKSYLSNDKLKQSVRLVSRQNQNSKIINYLSQCHLKIVSTNPFQVNRVSTFTLPLQWNAATTEFCVRLADDAEHHEYVSASQQ